jgi:hypothetical protein
MTNLSKDQTQLDNLQAEIDAVILEYDNRTTPFSTNEVFGSLKSISEKYTDRSDPVPLQAELFAFFMGFHDPLGEEQTVRNNLNNIIILNNTIILNNIIIEYWTNRAETLKNPLLKARYAYFVWHFGKLALNQSYPEMANLAMDAIIDILQAKKYSCELYARYYTERFLDLALKCNNSEKIKLAVQAMIDTEDSIATDELPGLWGFSFEQLLLQNRKKWVTWVTDEQHSKLLTDMENRFKLPSLKPRALERAFKLLLSYYQAKNERSKSRNLVLTYGEKTLQGIEAKDPLVAQFLLKGLYELYTDNGLSTEARVLEPEMLEKGQAAQNDMQTFKISTEIPDEQLNAFVREFLKQDLNDALQMLLSKFLPDKSQIETEYQQRPPFLSELCTKGMVDNNGQIIDVRTPEERLILDMSQRLSIVEPLYLRKTIAGIFQHYSVTADDILDHLFLSPAFEPAKRDFLKKGLEAYLKDDYMTALHILPPQIEAAVRRLARVAPNPVNILRLDPKTRGFSHKTLGDLLYNEGFQKVLGATGERVLFYLRVLLTEKLGWNLRNLTLHGLATPEDMKAGNADRVFHALLVLGMFRNLKKNRFKLIQLTKGLQFQNRSK